MIVADIQRILESWAPKEVAWERDNVGLQIGDADKKVRNILVTLDVSSQVITEARKKRIDLIISHHPLLFRPMKSISEQDRIGRMVTMLIKNNIALYSAHTNLDFSRSGVSFTLAGKLGIQNVGFLEPFENMQKKIIVFVPSDRVNSVMTAMSQAGAGRIGNYAQCSFQTEGTGTFNGSSETKPYAGKAGKLERVQEVRLEMILPSWKLNDVLKAMRESHPYEEIAYDVYNLANASIDHGAGAIGELKQSVSLQSFLQMVKNKLKTDTLRYSGDRRKHIKRVAVCGGSGSDLFPAAVRQKADVFVTADIRYHTFQEAGGQTAIIDAGHFETEQPVVQEVVHYLQAYCKAVKENIQVTASEEAGNPVLYYS